MNLNKIISYLNKSITKNSKMYQFQQFWNKLEIDNDYSFPPIDEEPKYHRKILHRNDIYEIVLIKWEKNSIAKLHYHPKNGCLLKVLSGKIREKKYKNNKCYQDEIYNKNQISYMDDSLGGHEIEALETSFSIHLYSPPNYYEKN
jgi:hypothetical protein